MYDETRVPEKQRPYTWPKRLHISGLAPGFHYYCNHELALQRAQATPNAPTEKSVLERVKTRVAGVRIVPCGAAFEAMYDHMYGVQSESNIECTVVAKTKATEVEILF